MQLAEAKLISKLLAGVEQEVDYVRKYGFIDRDDWEALRYSARYLTRRAEALEALANREMGKGVDMR